MKSLQKRFYKKESLINWITIGTVITFILVVTSCVKEPFERNLSPEAQIEQWIADLGSNDFKVRDSAAVNLIKSDLQGVDTMIKALTDERQNPKVRLGITYVFGEGGRQGGLNEIKKRKVVETLISLLWDDFISLRWQAYAALKKIGGSQAEEAIKKARADDNWLFNSALEKLNSTDPNQRFSGALYLIATDDPRVVEPLIAALEKETHLGAKWQEISTLGEIGIAHPRAIAILDKIATSDENEIIRKTAKEALKKISQK